MRSQSINYTFREKYSVSATREAPYGAGVHIQIPQNCKSCSGTATSKAPRGAGDCPACRAQAGAPGGVRAPGGRSAAGGAAAHPARLPLRRCHRTREPPRSPRNLGTTRSRPVLIAYSLLAQANSHDIVTLEALGDTSFARRRHQVTASWIRSWSTCSWPSRGLPGSRVLPWTSPCAGCTPSSSQTLQTTPRVRQGPIQKIRMAAIEYLAVLVNYLVILSLTLSIFFPNTLPVECSNTLAPI